MSKENLNTQKKITEEKVKQVEETKKVKKETKGVKEELSEILGLSSSYVDSIKETLGIKSRLSTFDANLLKVNKDINKQILNQRKEYDSIESLTKQIAKNEETITKAEKVRDNLTTNLSKKSKEKLAVANAEVDAISDLQKEQDAILDSEGDLTDKQLARIDAIQEEIAAREGALDSQIDSMGFSERQAFFSEQNLKAIKAEQAEREKELKQKEEIEKKLGAFGGILKGISKIPLVGDLVNTDKILEKARDKVKETGSGVKGLGAGLKEAGKQMMDGLTNPANLALAAITAFGNALIKNNKTITEFERSMVMSSSEAKKLKGEFAATAFASDDLNTTSTNLIKTFTQISEQFGFIANFSQDTLATATKLEKTVGVSAEAAGSLAAASSLSDESFENQYKNALGASYELQRQAKVQINLKHVLEESSKITGATRAQLGGSVEEIAKAVTQAKLFGASLEDVASAGRQLLDFEDSITNELEAELMLGKDLNLERARAAALAGDQVTLAQELQEQAGSFDEFGKMNVLQQEALAAALGMQSDQLADILFQQEVQGKTAQELRALGKDELADRLEQQNAQQAFNAAVDQLKTIFVDVMKVFDPLLQGFTFLIEQAFKFKDVIAAVGLGFGTIYSLTKLSNVELRKSIILQGRNLIKSIANAAAFAIANPFKALAGLAAAGAVYAYMNSKKGDDVLSPGSGAGGYGNRVLFGPEGAISLNNKDTVIAGTKLFRGNDVMAGPAGSISMGNNEAKRTNDLLKQVLNKPAPQPKIVMNDQELGTAVDIGAFSIQ